MKGAKTQACLNVSECGHGRFAVLVYLEKSKTGYSIAAPNCCRRFTSRHTIKLNIMELRGALAGIEKELTKLQLK